MAALGEDVAMEEETGVQGEGNETTASPPPQFRLGLLQVIKTAQGQNGVKHGDYARYRRHCTSKLRGLYKSLKFQHGRSKYIKRKVEAGNATDVRFLHIPLFSAERAWAYAMQLKKEIEVRMDVRKRRHMVSRLTKAAAWAKDVARIANQRCDVIGILEADGYLAFVSGSLLMEKEHDWSLALARLTRAKRVFTELGKLVKDMDTQTLCLQQAEDLEPSIRYCQYQIGRQGQSVPEVKQLLDIADKERQSDGTLPLVELQAQLSVEASHSATQSSTATAIAPTQTTKLDWLGRAVVVKHERVKLCIQQFQELQAQLSSSPTPPPDSMAQEGGGHTHEGRLSLLDRIVSSLQEARALTRNAMKASTEGDASYSELTELEQALGGVIAEKVVEKASLLASDLQVSFDTVLERSMVASPSGPAGSGKRGGASDKKSTAHSKQGGGGEKRREHVRVEDCIRALDVLLRGLAELADQGAQGGGRAGEALHDRAMAQNSMALASRSYLVAHTLLSSGRWVEAYALFTKASERAKAAASQTGKEEGAAGGDGREQIGTLVERAEAFRAVAHAEHAAASASEREAVEGRVQGISLVDGSLGGAGAAASGVVQLQGSQTKYLAEALDVWEAFAGAASGKLPRIYPLPYRMQPIPARAIMLDTAFTHLAYPSIEHRLKKVEKKSVLSSLAGWAGWGGAK